MIIFHDNPQRNYRFSQVNQHQYVHS